jgi:serine/threonine-protein kinase
MTRLPCPPGLWAEFSRLLDEALEIDDQDRGAWLERIRRDSPEPFDPLRRVLEADASRDPGAAPFESLPWDLLEDEDAPRRGTVVGPYTLEAELGVGGMGSVWSARRSDGAYERLVALKLPHVLGRDLRARFRRERDILARLSHPNIAQFLDAGVAPDGRPYLALELVEGQPILDAARLARLGIDERLKWFRAVLDAVAYAHGRLIVHRDIKPSNVLVTGAGVVKLLDFGIAKLIEPTASGRADATQLTREDVRPATPDYAAPEQLAGGEITVATDVWALGALLFELLTGRRPFSRADRLGTERDRVVPLASRRVDEPHALALGLQARALSRRLEGDLDAILAKALAFDSRDRYASVEAFAADLDRFVGLQPIVARPVSRWVRTRLFARRHRVGLALSSLLVVAVLAGVLGVLLQARATAAAARRADATKNFLVEVFKGSDPRIARAKPRGEITARELLDLAARELEEGFSDDPETRIELLGLTATIYTYLDEIGSARRLAELGRQQGQRYLDANDSRLLETWTLEIWLALEAGDLGAARAHLADVDRHLTANRLDHSVHRAGYHLAASDVAAASGDRRLQRQELERAADLYPAVAPRDSGYAATLSNLGVLSLGRGATSEALDLLDRALVAVRAADSDVGTDLARIHARRGRVLLELSRFADARDGLDTALALYAATVGPDHVTTWAPRAARARAAAGLGRAGEADHDLGELVRLPGWEEPRFARYRHEANLHRGLALTRLGRTSQAAAILAESITNLGEDPELGAEVRRARIEVAATRSPR